MAVKVELHDGTEYVLKGSYRQVARARRLALLRSQMIEIEDDKSGEVVLIDPNAIARISKADAAEAALVAAL